MNTTAPALTTPERNRLDRIARIDEQITDLMARRAALLDPPFKPGDQVVFPDESSLVWTVTGFDRIDPRLVHATTGARERYNVPASQLRLAGGAR